MGMASGTLYGTRGVGIEMDARLMLGVRSGDQKSFGMLLSRHRLPVMRFLGRMVGNQAVAEELSQDVFLRVYRSRERYSPTARFTTWLFRIAKHRGLNWLRDERHERACEPLDLNAPMQVRSREASLEERLIHGGKGEEIRKAILRLPAKQRAAVLMHKYEEMGYAQIANALGCSESAVKSLLFRAYETLRGRLAHYA